MKNKRIQFGAILAGALTVLANPTSSRASVNPGFYGQQLDGELDPIYNVFNLQNTSNLGSPLAVVGAGAEFSASFTDIFSQQWNLSLDLQDNYQIVMQTSSPNPNANIGSGNFIQWHLYGFAFDIQDVQKVSVPGQDRSTVAFDANDIWIAFNGLAAYAPYNSYTFQIVPSPEPAVLSLAAAGGLCLVMLRRRARS